MPSPKQVRKSYKSIRYHIYRLQNALSAAHALDCLVYTNYPLESPCSSLDELRKRVELTTEKPRAQALKDECMNELKGIW